MRRTGLTLTLSLAGTLAAAGCGLDTSTAALPTDPATTVANGERGLLTFRQSAVGVGMDSTIPVARGLNASCGVGCVVPQVFPLTTATATLDPAIADIGAIAPRHDGS